MKRAPSGKGLAFVLKTSTLVFALVVITKIFNFLKKILIGNLFGISWEADSFFAASYLPYYVAVFFEGVIYLGFIPLFSKVLAENGEESAKRFIGEILPWVVFLTGALVLGACLGAPWLIREIVPGFRPGNQALTQTLFCVVSFVIVFISLSSFFQALNSFFGDYLRAASSGLTDSVIMIAVTLATYRVWGIYGDAWGSVAGALAAFSLQAFFLHRSQKIFPLKMTVRKDSFLKLLKILLPLGIIWVFQMIPLVILNRFGSGMWQGTISAMSISLGVMVVPTGLVSQTILISIFPSLVKQSNEKTGDSVRETFFQTLRAAFLVLIPAGFLLSGFSDSLANLFFGGAGAMTEGTRRISGSLFYLGWAAFAFYADLFMTQSLITVRKTVPAIFLCLTRALLTYGLCYFLSWVWDYQGLALSFSLGLAVNFFLLFPVFFRMTPLKGEWNHLFGYCLKLFLAACPLLGGGWLLKAGYGLLGIMPGKALIFAAVAVFSFLGLSVYLAVLYRFRIKELRSLFDMLRMHWAQKKWWITDTGDV